MFDITSYIPLHSQFGAASPRTPAAFPASKIPPSNPFISLHILLPTPVMGPIYTPHERGPAGAQYVSVSCAAFELIALSPDQLVNDLKYSVLTLGSNSFVADGLARLKTRVQ